MSLTNSQQYALSEVLSGKNVFITGKAGTGKTYLTKVIYDELVKNGKSVVLSASTGTAALNLSDAVGVQASTVHSLLGIPLGKDKIIDINYKERYHFYIHKNKLELLSCFDVVIIDEISMLRLDAFGRAMAILDKAERYRTTPIQRIVIGDFLQLPPVVTAADRKGLSEIYNPYEMYAFDFTKKQFKNFDEADKKTHSVWQLQDFVSIELNEIVRQENTEFSDVLSRIRMGDKYAIDYINEQAHIVKDVDSDIIRLYPLKKDVEKYNNKRLRMLLEEGEVEEIYFAEIFGSVTDKDFNSLSEQKELRICPNCRVRLTVNSPAATPKLFENQGSYTNGSLGTYLGLDGKYMMIQLDNGDVVRIQKIEKEILGPWYEVEDGDETYLTRDVIGVVKQYPVNLAFAMTIHKAQGLTLDRAFISPGKIFSEGQLYVALSRLTDIDGLYLDEAVGPIHVKCDGRVRDILYKT